MLMENWNAISKSAYPWEQEAIDFLRAQLPSHEPYRGWSNFEFVADDGSINEVDALILTPVGFFLIEIKSRPGVLAGDIHTWKWRHDGREHIDDNPLFLTNRKAKKLKSLLARQPAFKGAKVPFIEPLVFCSAPTLEVRLPPTATTRLCLRDPEAGTSPSAIPGVIDMICRRAGLDPFQRGEINAPAALSYHAGAGTGGRPPECAREPGR